MGLTKFVQLMILINKFQPRSLIMEPHQQIKAYFFSEITRPIELKVYMKVGKGAKIRNRYNQVPHLTQDINGKVTKEQLDTINESQEVSPFPAGDHKAHINRHAQEIANTRQNKNIKDPQKKFRLGTVSKIFYWRA